MRAGSSKGRKKLPSIDEHDFNTTRERYEKVHTEEKVCNDCHAHFDPYGFAFEQFDELGRYREDENGFPVDASASARHPIDSTSMEFDGLEEFASQLAADDSVTDCVSGLASIFAYAGAGGQSCLAEEERTALSAGEIGLVEFFARLAGTPHFRTRAWPSGN